MKKNLELPLIGTPAMEGFKQVMLAVQSAGESARVPICTRAEFEVSSRALINKPIMVREYFSPSAANQLVEDIEQECGWLTRLKLPVADTLSNGPLTPTYSMLSASECLDLVQTERFDGCTVDDGLDTSLVWVTTEVVGRNKKNRFVSSK